MLQVQEAVVDWSGSKHKHLLLRPSCHHFKELAITVRRSITEMVCFVYNDNFCLICDLVHETLIFFKQEIRMINNLEWIKAVKYIRKILLDGRFPDGNTSGGRNNQNDILTFFLHKALNQHEANECLSQSYTVTQESAGITVCNLHQAVVSILLVLG